MALNAPVALQIKKEPQLTKRQGGRLFWSIKKSCFIKVFGVLPDVIFRSETNVSGLYCV
jgi:hypothetical protein